VLRLAFLAPLLEINQQRLIAGKLKSRFHRRRQAHSRESILHALIPRPGAPATLLLSCFPRPEIAPRSRAECTPQPHRDARSGPEVSRGRPGQLPVPTTTAPPAIPSRRTA